MKRTNIKTLESVAIKVFSKYPIAFAYLFGSQATGKTHASSDFDIALSFTSASKSEAFDLILDILPELASELKMNSDKIDISNFDQLPLSVRFRVIRDGRLVYCKDILLHRTKALKTVLRYYDEEPFFTKAMQAFLERTAAS